jgi:DNA-binding CsgD family transcriptional regulator/tetratricopeptide (TPR) repeat protein
MPARTSSPALVGRDADVDVLRGAIEASSRGSPRFVIVRGEAGIGKTRLVREATAAAAEDGTLVLLGECLDIGPAGLPYLPLAGALRGLARQLDADRLERVVGPGRRELAAIVPELASEADAGAGLDAQALPSGLAQARLFERVLGLLRALTAETTTILVVEDVHWIDRATRDLLTFLSRNLTDERLALVLTCREHDLPRGHPILAWLADIARAASTTVIELERLDRSAVERQLRVLADGATGPELADRVWRRSQGNPLLVEELAAAGGAGERPSSIVEILLARVRRLDPEARRVVDAVALAARPVDERLLAEVLDTPEGDVETGLRSALDTGVLELEPAGDRYRFRHELLREAVEQELLPGARRRLHERYARRLEARPDLADTSPVGAAADLAHHFAEAGLAAEAYARAIDAAAAAEAVHAYADAHRHLERAIGLEPAAGETGAAARGALRRRAANDADLGGDVPRALELTREAIELVDPAAEPVTAGMLHSRLGYLQWALGDSTTALAAHREAVRLVPAEPPTAERARVLASLGGALLGAGLWADSRDLCREAVACAVAAGARSEESQARNMLGSDLVALGDVEAGIEELRLATRLAADRGPANTLIVGHYNLGVSLLALGRLEEALESAEAAREVARDAGLVRRFGQDLVALEGDILLRLARVVPAGIAIAEGLALDPAGVGSVYLSTTAAWLAAIRGDLAEADRRIAALDLESVDPDIAAYAAGVGAEAWWLAGRYADALAIADTGLERLEGLDDVLWTAPLVAIGLRAAAELAEAGRLQRRGTGGEDGGALGRLRAKLADIAPRAETAAGRGWVALAQGELARVEGTDDDEAWARAIAAFDAVPEPLVAAYARLRAAEASLRSQGLRADVAGLLGDAVAVTDAAGARPLGDALAGLASRARIQLPATGAAVAAAPTPAAPADVRPAPAPADPRAAAMALGLSTREVEVLELVVAGMSNGEIADRLFITRKTAAVHVTHILDKLGVANRVGAAMIGARVGMGAAGQAADDAAD